MARCFGLLILGLLSACATLTPTANKSLSAQDALTTSSEAKAIDAARFSELQTRFSLEAKPAATTGLGGLKPAVGLAQADYSCETSANMLTVRSGLTGSPLCRSYLAEFDNDVVQLRTPAELKTRFAPIESREEALSYLLAMEPSLGSAGDAGQPRVVAVEGGYRIALYDKVCTNINEILSEVSREGEIKRIHTKQIASSGLNPACDG